jgi:hypothetical protein
LKNLTTALPGIFFVILAIILSTQPGCGGGSTPPTTTPEVSGSSKPPATDHKVQYPKGRLSRRYAPPSLDLPKDVLQEVEKNIKAWVAKKGATIQRDQSGKIMIKNAKGRRSKVPATVLPPNDKLPKAVLDQMEARIKEWADKKGYATAPGKDGHLIVKNTKGKEATPPLDIFLASLPDDLAPVSGAPGSSPTGSGSGSPAAEAADDGSDDAEAGDGS